MSGVVHSWAAAFRSKVDFKPRKHQQLQVWFVFFVLFFPQGQHGVIWWQQFPTRKLMDCSSKYCSSIKISMIYKSVAFCLPPWADSFYITVFRHIDKEEGYRMTFRRNISFRNLQKETERKRTVEERIGEENKTRQGTAVFFPPLTLYSLKFFFFFLIWADISSVRLPLYTTPTWFSPSICGGFFSFCHEVVW